MNSMSARLADILHRLVQLHVPMAAALTCPPLTVSSRHKRGNGQPSLLCLLSLFLPSVPKPRNGYSASSSRPHTTLRDTQLCSYKMSSMSTSDVKLILGCHGFPFLWSQCPLRPLLLSACFLMKILFPRRPQN